MVAINKYISVRNKSYLRICFTVNLNVNGNLNGTEVAVRSGC